MASPDAVDHVIWAVDDLDDAARRLEAEHGIRSVAGGRHPEIGSENRLVPLGDSYLELLAGFPDLALGLAGWMVRTEDLAGHATRLGIDVLPMTRTRPDGVVLRWRLAGLAPALAGSLPVFIEWDLAERGDHPGQPAGDHRLAAIEVGGDPAELARWLGGPPPREVTVVDGPPGISAVVLEGPTGPFRLTP